MASEVSGLSRLAGRDSRDMPSFPAELEVLVWDARRAGGVAVQPPLPVHTVVPALERVPDREAA